MGRVFVFVGVILIVVGIVISQSSMGVTINRRRADAETAAMAKYAIGGGVGGLGLLFAVGGVVSISRRSKQAKRNAHLVQTGVAAEGTVTFVDRNYQVLVNKTPIYSIVEYVYSDAAGKQHTRRISNLPSEVVIRKQITVGAKVPIKYSAQDPSESVLVIS